MREILFRGKRKDNGKFVEGYYRYDDIPPFTNEPRTEIVRGGAHWWGYSMIPYEVVPETVGQYTGLTDTNGTKIFEGDIVKHHQTLWGEDVSDIGLVLWCERTCKFYRTSKCDTVGSFEIWKETTERYEVIGNIHDNPELLKGVTSDA